MDKLEEQIQEKENAYITMVENIISQPGSNRTKIALINKHYIKYLVAVDDLVSASNTQTQPVS